MKRQYSGQQLIFRLFTAMLVVTLLCLLICGGYALNATQESLVFSNKTAMDVYFSGVTHTLEDLEQFCDTMYVQGSCFRTLALDADSISADQMLQAQNTMRQMVHSRTTANTGIMVFDDRLTSKFFHFGSSFLGGVFQPVTISVMQQIRGYWLEQETPEKLGWQVMVTDGGNAVVLMQARRYRSVYLCTMLDLNAYAQQMQGSSPITYAFLNTDQILTNADYAQSNQITLEQMLAANDSRLHTSGLRQILQTRFDDYTGLGLCSMISTNSMWGDWWIFVLLLSLSLTVICITFGCIYRAAARMVLYPLNKIREASRQITQGATKLEKTPERVQEFADIQDALDAFVTQKVLLETEKNQQAFQKEHALLQYYQLQTRSHFLLNCLKSLYNLTARGEHEKALRMITRFSNHIRYIFHDSLTFVPIRAELEEVDDYLEIIDMERCDHILLNKNVDDQLLEFPIPPLLIQTFAENFQKHNPQGSKILRFGIHIDRIELESKNYVRIRLTDNGIGYSEEALNQMQNQSDVFAQAHVGIQNLCRRIDILYKNQSKIAFFNLPQGGACSVFYLPADSGAAPWMELEQGEGTKS